MKWDKKKRSPWDKFTNWVRDSSNVAGSGSLYSGGKHAEKNDDQILEGKVRKIVEEIFEEQDLPWQMQKKGIKPPKDELKLCSCGAELTFSNELESGKCINCLEKKK